jgi:hypothetical protein
VKTAGINELRALVADALTKTDAEKLTEAMVRATELAQEDDSASAATKSDVANLRADLQKQIGDLHADLQKQIGNVKSELTDKLRGQNMWTIGTFVLLLVSVVIQHIWR